MSNQLNNLSKFSWHILAFVKVGEGVEGLKFTETTPAAYTRLMTVNYPTHLNMTF